MTRVCLLACFLGALPGGSAAQTNADLVNDPGNTEQVTTHSMGYGRRSYSPLTQINTSTIKRLVPIWNTSVMNDLR
jgi:alcohol dehydrogenase (cytochrome c)